MNIFKKVLLSTTLLSILVSTLVTPVTHAQQTSAGRGQWWNPHYEDFLSKVNDASPNEIFGERYTHAQVVWIIDTLLNILGGVAVNCANSTDPVGCLTEAMAAGESQGVVLTMARGIDIMSQTKPLSGVDYVAGKLQKFDLVDSSYAQAPTTATAGFGFANSLAIVQPLWTSIRDVAYSLVIFAILILAFMVMLRAKVSAQASITVQSALPRVALGLIMITFSYAIAGFMVDLIFVLQGLLSGVIASSSLTGGPTAGKSALDSFNAMNNVLGSVFSFILAFILIFFPLAIGAAGAGLGVGFFISGGSGLIVAGVIIVVILLIIILITMFRIFSLQLKTITTILLLVVVSPLLMLMGIIKSGTISNWMKNVFGQLVTLLAISATIVVANVILWSTNDVLFGALDFFGVEGSLNTFDINSVDSFQNNPVGYFPTAFNMGGVSIMGAVIALGVFMSIPKMAEAARDYVLHGKGAFGFTGAGEATGGILGAGVGIGAGYAGQRASSIEGAASKAGITPWEQAALKGQRGRYVASKLGSEALKRVGGVLK